MSLGALGQVSCSRPAQPHRGLPVSARKKAAKRPCCKWPPLFPESRSQQGAQRGCIQPQHAAQALDKSLGHLLAPRSKEHLPEPPPHCCFSPQHSQHPELAACPHRGSHRVTEGDKFPPGIPAQGASPGGGAELVSVSKHERGEKEPQGAQGGSRHHQTEQGMDARTVWGAPERSEEGSRCPGGQASSPTTP